MSRRLSRISLALVILLSSEVWALGLGEIRLQSALNEPLRAEIELLSATPEELAGLRVAMAAGDTFERYGLDRPAFLQGIVFQIRRSGRADGNVVEVRSANAITEPFVTFLVEASWARGRLLREYTILLDPPTFAPQAAAQSAPAVTAPSRSEPTDSGRIERAAPAPRAAETAPVRTSPPRVAPAPAPYTPPAREPLDESRPYDTTQPGDIVVQKNETLWGITSRVRDDGRLTMNQTMLAIYEANPEAFGGNINVMRAGATLRIPTANDVFQISRETALDEVQRQHAAWQPGYTYVDSTASEPEPVDDYVVDEPASVDEAVSQNDLTLVPPDEDLLDDSSSAYDDTLSADAASREADIEQRIFDLEAADVPVQQSLIEIRDNELAALREELAQIRGEVYEPALDDPFADNADGDMLDQAEADETAAAADEVEAAAEEAQPTARPTRRAQPTMVEKILGILSSWWVAIVVVVLIVGGLLFWFMRRGDDDDDVDSWRSIDTDDGLNPSDLSATESLRAPSQDDSIMVVEQESSLQDMDETVDAPGPDFAVDFQPAAPDAEDPEATAETGRFDSLEDTFSSETAVNLDQSDPIAEADFHMAYGLYDQAADLINGALGAEPERQDLLSKLCEIYFVWGNRDAFTDAASRLKMAVGDDENAEWDKIVIMGQQIAGEHELFAGAGVGAATKAVDMSFEDESEGTGALDMEFGADNDDASDVFDLGDADSASADDGDDLDFAFDAAAEDASAFEPEPEPEPDTVSYDLTAEMPSADDTAEATAEATVETPTIEQQFEGLSSSTSELPSLEDTLGGAPDTTSQLADQTAEINLDDLGLDLNGLDETEIASLEDLDATGELPALGDLADPTSRNPIIDPDATGEQTILREDATGINEGLDDAALLEATGVTQVLPEDFAVETLGDGDATMLAPGLGVVDTELGDDQETMLASLDDDDSDFDYAKTEALPQDAFTGNSSLDETGELPAIASTDVDLDLDDLTAALQISEIGDTIEQLRDDATVEQPRPNISEDESPTMALEPGEFSDDLHDARTMTEVGTKLDLARAYVDMGDPAGARSILEEVLDEGDQSQRQQAQQLLDSLPS